MPLHHHLLIALSYAVVAAIMAVALPYNFPALEPGDSLLLGGEVLLACGLVHGLLAGLGNGRLESEMAWLRLRFAELADELARARNESRLILEAIESSSRVRQGQTANIGKVMDEVRLLQGLVEQYSERHKSVGGRAQPAPTGEMPPPMTPAAAPSPTSRAAPVRYMKGIDDATVLDIVREALRADRIDLYLQPIVSLPQRKRRYYECFSRIRAGDDSVVMPEQYIGVAEREGLIGTIDNMLLFRCIQLVRRVQKKNQNLGFFCNISQHTLADTGFFRDFLAFLSDNADLAANLSFEFAQSSVDRLGETAARHLEKLAEVGFGFSMDQVASLDLDFADLADRHFHFVKIEAARLIEQAGGEGGEDKVQALKAALDRHGIDLIVEKVESEKTLVELLDFQIDFGQGYLFGEPRVSKD